MTEKSVLIAIPCYGAIVPATVRTMLSIQREAMAKSFPLEFYMLENQSLITRARNKCAHYFMYKTRHTHMLFLDSDVSFEPDVFWRLLDADVPLIGAPYPRKVDSGSLCIRGGVYSTDRALDIVEIKTVGKIEAAIATGTMLISWEVFHTLEWKYQNDNKSRVCLQNGEQSYAWFTTPIGDDGNELPEDYAFCRDWTRVGGKIYALTGAAVGHTGTKMWTTEGL